MTDPTWLLSPWDHQLHAFPKFGEVVSEALCQHSVRTRALAEGEGRRCMACLLLLGDAIAGRLGNGTQWRM
ncbi:MAG: hypothetical protein ACJ72N_13780 [Labedaea sp.]